MKIQNLLVFLILVLFMNACGGAKSSMEPPLTGPAISVQITKDYCPSLEIQAGMQIAWTNADDEDRALWLERKGEDGAILEMGGTDLLQPGSTFSITLTDPGQYIYYCSIDRSEFGTLSVSP